MIKTKSLILFLKRSVKMRRIVIAIIILIISVSVGIFSCFFIKNACNQALSDVEEVLHSALTEDVEKVNLLCVQTNLKWKEKVFLLNILIGREYTQEVSKYLNKMTYFSKNADWDSIITNAEECKAELVHIIESNEPQLSTIL